MSTSDKPTVLIVGAGLGGLMLGALLEKAGIPYMVFERAAAVKPLGSALSIGSALMPVFTQLGILDEFITMVKPLAYIVSYKESLEPFTSSDYTLSEEFTGYPGFIVTRPILYDLIRKQLPSHKILLGKRILGISEEDDKVTVQAADNIVYNGDIIVGADGAYSAVRQRLYERLRVDGKLPVSDQEDLPFSCTCLVGQTTPLDPEEFPVLKEPFCQFLTVLGENKPYTWVIFGTAQNTMSWMVIHHLDKVTKKEAEDQRFHKTENSEWGSHAAQAMCEETRHFPIPIGDGKQTMGNLYDRTPKELISKVMLEEKVFDTWYSGRTVLLGDACHKLHPSGGRGAVTAMHDAIALANLLYVLPSSTSSEITKMFEEYKSERYPIVIDTFKNSQMPSTRA
ncbi:hypothetical protein BGX29_008959 [Mortierella sp. GBA35]|nr:hypothetical protein BGX29_008959 [Mortierella sp. GBA35]